MRAVPFIERPIEGLAPCYLLKGSDGCIIRAVADKILSVLPPDEREINYDEFGDDTAIADVLAALGILSGMRSKGDAAAKILAIITSSYRKILHCAISSLGDGELAAALGASEASIRVTRSNIRERKRSVSGYVVKLKDKTEYLYELEYKFKSGLISDENALRLAVGKLAADAR